MHIQLNFSFLVFSELISNNNFYETKLKKNVNTQTAYDYNIF